MKNCGLAALLVTLAGSLIAAESTPKDIVLAAAKKLGQQTNYSWTTTVEVPEDAPFKPGPTHGKADNAGFVLLKWNFGPNEIEAALSGKKGTCTVEDGSWKSIEELEEQEGPGRFMAVLLRIAKRPADEAAEIASYAKELKKEGDAYISDLTAEGAKALQTFKMQGGDSVVVNDASGAAKFWVKDGVLTKYEFKLKGMMKFGENNFPNDRKNIVEIRDVNATKVEVPAAAKKKLT